MKRTGAVCFAALLVAACGGQDDAATGDRKTAAGEVLGGSISDAMIPLDSVTSQSPTKAGGDDVNASNDDGDEGTSEGAGAADRSPPVPSPSPSPSETPEE